MGRENQRGRLAKCQIKVLLQGGRVGFTCGSCWEDLRSQPIPRSREQEFISGPNKTRLDTAGVGVIYNGWPQTYGPGLCTPLPQPLPCLRAGGLFNPKPFPAALQLPPAVEIRPIFQIPNAKFQIAFPNSPMHHPEPPLANATSLGGYSCTSSPKIHPLPVSESGCFFPDRG